ncbi:hypothetical protein BDR05DRAFT_1063742, partial [Suillus weaverae]
MQLITAIEYCYTTMPHFEARKPLSEVRWSQSETVRGRGQILAGLRERIKALDVMYRQNNHSSILPNMQLSVLFSALVSFVILAAASPTPAEAISKRSSKRELQTGLDDYDELDKKRELQTGLDDYDELDKKRELQTGLDDYDELDKKRELQTGLDDYDELDKKRELQTGLDDYDELDKKRELQT